ncbi:MAG TPA: hypothetical protein V6D47_07450 [Oscillatoriaceae cyanobacterium]
MADAAFHPVTLVERWQETPELAGVCLSPQDPALAATFTTPGQYLEVRLPSGESGYFAIANQPGAARFELLVKRGTPLTDALLALPVGTRLDASGAQGAGYPVEEQHGKDVLLFAVGSGISPIRSLIGHLASHREDYAGVTLFIGARTPDDFAYAKELAAWERAGMQVVRVVSRVEDGTGFVHGYVQEALRAHPIEPARTVAYVCGMPAMVAGVSAELTARGVGANVIFQNF